MIFNRKKTASDDPRRSNEKLSGGRRDGENENPYLSARRTWNSHTGGIVSFNQSLLIMGVLAMLLALVAVGGIIRIGLQSKFIPYQVEVDKLGRSAAVARADRASPVGKRSIATNLAAFISNARMVTPDVALQRKAVFDVYAMLAPGDPATQKMGEWLNGTEESSPFKRAAKEMVSVDKINVLPQTPETWEVDWVETTRDRQGVPKDKPASWRALITVKIVEPTNETTEEEFIKNPLGTFAKDFSWAKQQQ